MARERRSKRKCCSSCNSQIFSSYILALFSTALTVGGVYLAFWKWDYAWLILSIAGLVLMCIGSCMYYCGSVALLEENCEDDESHDDTFERRRKRKMKQKLKCRGFSSDHLMSDRTFGDSRSVSQLSLNMIPQYFSAMDTGSSTTTNIPVAGVNSPMNYSQVFSVNGQSFLILPISGDSNSNENCIQMQNMFFKVPNNDSLLRKAEDTKSSRKTTMSTETTTEATILQSRNDSRKNDGNNSEGQSIQNNAENGSRYRHATASQPQTSSSGATAFWIPVNSGEETIEFSNSRTTSTTTTTASALPPTASRFARHSATFRRQTGTAIISGNQSRVQLNSNDNDRDQSHASHTGANMANDASLVSSSLSTENTPLIRNQSTLPTVCGADNDGCRTGEQCDSRSQVEVFVDDETSRSNANRKVTATDKTSTPPPSYEEVLSVELRDNNDVDDDDDDGSSPSTEVLIFGTV